METQQFTLLLALFFIAATLYSTVGHAGASGYLAAMALLSVAPATMRPTALVLNILVASVAVYRFRNANYFSWQTLWPFLLGSVPFAFLGGSLKLDTKLYVTLVGLVLLCSAAYLGWRAWQKERVENEFLKHIPFVASVFIGMMIGFLSGITGTGGGIFLSPLLIVMGWAGPKNTAGISAPFILINSSAALSGQLLLLNHLPTEIPWLAASALAGAAIGTHLGLVKFSQRNLFITLAVVMLLAGLKLLLA